MIYDIAVRIVTNLRSLSTTWDSPTLSKNSFSVTLNTNLGVLISATEIKLKYGMMNDGVETMVISKIQCVCVYAINLSSLCLARWLLN